MEIYSIGHSTRTMEELLGLLREHGIQTLVDVRRFPKSHKVPHFNGDNLRQVLTKAGIDYVYMGEQLGGYRKKGYEYYTMTEPFQEGVTKLMSIGRHSRTAFMCAERFPWRCHRRYIGFELQRLGAHLIHIIDPGRDWIPKKQTKLPEFAE